MKYLLELAVCITAMYGTINAVDVPTVPDQTQQYEKKAIKLGRPIRVPPIIKEILRKKNLNAQAKPEAMTFPEPKRTQLIPQNGLSDDDSDDNLYWLKHDPDLSSSDDDSESPWANDGLEDNMPW